MSRVDLVVLGLLTSQPMHGYRIVSFFEKRGLSFWTRIKTPSVYKALQRLEKQGYIIGKLQIVENNPPKKVFKLTENGRQQFLKILRHYLFCKDQTISPLDFWNALRFVHHNISRSEFIRALENHEEWLSRTSCKMQAKHDETLRKGRLSDMPFYAPILMQMMNEMSQLELNTLNSIKEAALKSDNKKDFAEEQ